MQRVQPSPCPSPSWCRQRQERDVVVAATAYCKPAAEVPTAEPCPGGGLPHAVAPGAASEGGWEESPRSGPSKISSNPSSNRSPSRPSSSRSDQSFASSRGPATPALSTNSGATADDESVPPQWNAPAGPSDPPISALIQCCAATLGREALRARVLGRAGKRAEGEESCKPKLLLSCSQAGGRGGEEGRTKHTRLVLD